jgi:peptide/nickel transport system substrate-binding protein
VIAGARNLFIMGSQKIALFFFLLAIMLLQACQGKEESPLSPSGLTDKFKPAYGDAIVYGSIGDASNLIPFLATDSASHEISDLVYNGLVKYDKDLNIVGDLAESWEISPDGLSITFHLRKDIRFHDGAPCTVDDVLFTFHTILDPKVPSAYKEDYRRVKEVQKIDETTFKAIYDDVYAPALISWGALSVLPSHLLKGVDITQSPLARNPVGTGPYRFKEWKTQQKITLTFFQEYFEGRPYIDQYIFRVIPDQATMYLELKAGGVDFMFLTPLQYARATDSNFFKQNFKKYRYLARGYTYLGYNLQRFFFQDKRVRQALSYAIDKQEIIDGVLFGLGRVCTGPYKPDTFWYNPNVRQYPYDPEKAKKLLDEAGWKDTDGDGILDKDGQPFAFTIITNQGNEVRKKTGEIIQRHLSKVGIRVNLRIIEWAAFLSQFIDKHDFDATLLGWTIVPDPDLLNVWHSSKTGEGELNFVSFQNKEADEMLERGVNTFDQRERKKYYDRFQEILAEEQPYTFLFVPDDLPIIHARFHNVEPAPAGIMYNFNHWYVPKSMQRYSLEP